MSKLSVEEINRLASLARIELTDTEIERLSVDMPKIVGFVEELQEAPKSAEVGAQAVSSPTLRPDEVSSIRLNEEQLKKLAPKWKDGQIKTPAVF